MLRNLLFVTDVLSSHGQRQRTGNKSVFQTNWFRQATQWQTIIRKRQATASIADNNGGVSKKSILAICPYYGI